MGIKTWAVTSKVLRRIGRDRTESKDGDNKQDRGVTMSMGDASGRARAAAAATRRRMEKLPLAVQILDDPGTVNRQLDSPLFKLPAELRELIWDYALSAYEDSEALYPLDKPYSRPGQAAPLRIAVDLLLTCRAVYLEAFLVPFQVNPMTVFDGHPDVVPPDNPLQCTPSNLRLCRKLRPWQFANVTSVDMSVQQFMLEGGSIERVSRLLGNKGRHAGHEARGFTLAGYASFGPAKETPKPQQTAGENSGITTITTTTPPPPPATTLRPGAEETRAALTRSIFMGKKVTHLTLRMSRTDWWAWTSHPQAGAADAHEALRLEPMINVTDRRATSGAMLAGFAARKATGEGQGQQQQQQQQKGIPDFGLDEFEKQGRWGMQFAEYWPDLQSFELVLETYARKEPQLDTVVECAKLWTFPLREGPAGQQLQWDGDEVKCLRWRGAREYGYDRELGMDWLHEEEGEEEEVEGRRNRGMPLTPWRPGGEVGNEGQEFVIKSLVFTRRRSVDATTVSLNEA